MLSLYGRGLQAAARAPGLAIENRKEIKLFCPFCPSVVKSCFLPVCRDLLAQPLALLCNTNVPGEFSACPLCFWGHAENKRSYRICDNNQDKSELCHFGQPRGNPLVLCWNLLRVLGSRKQQPGHIRAPSRGFVLSQGEDRDGSCSGAGWEPPQFLLI